MGWASLSARGQSPPGGLTVARVNQPTAEGVSLLMPYINNIIGAREQGLSRSETWAAVQAAEAEGGPQVAGASIFDMNYMWTQAGNVINAQTAFNAAQAGQAIEASMIAQAPWAAASAASSLNPVYQIRYQYQVGEGPNAPTAWGVTDWPGSLAGATTDDIEARAMGSAQSALDIGSPGARAQLGAEVTGTVSRILNVQILQS